MIQPGFISLTIKSNPKHDPSGNMVIPVYLFGEEKLQINNPLRMISHPAYQTDQSIPHLARYNLANPSANHL